MSLTSTLQKAAGGTSELQWSSGSEKGAALVCAHTFKHEQTPHTTGTLWVQNVGLTSTLGKGC